MTAIDLAQLQPTEPTWRESTEPTSVIGTRLPREAARLVDRRTGVLTDVTVAQNRPEWPTAFRWALADVAPIGRVLPLAADTSTTGTAFGDADPARAAAVGEAVERYCGNAVPRDLHRASHAELISRGERAVDPAELVLYSQRSYREPGMPFVEFTSNLEVLWARGRDLVDDAPIWVPASLVWVNWFIADRASQPPTNFVNFAGVAAGAGRGDAEGAALEELLERDATEIWWRTGGPVSPATPSSALEAMLLPPIHSELELSPLQIPSPFGVPIRAVVARDRAAELLTIGIAARQDPDAAIAKAAGEAISLLALAHGLLDPAGSLWQAMDLGLLDGASYLPWRRDRAYRRSYRSDLRDLVDLGCQAQWYLDPRAQDLAEAHLAAMGAGPALPPERHLGGADRRDTYLQLLTEAGFRPVSVELTTTDVAAAGLSVARVIVPGLIPNAPAAFAYDGGSRIRHEPVRLGWADHPLELAELSPLPLPHT